MLFGYCGLTKYNPVTKAHDISTAKIWAGSHYSHIDTEPFDSINGEPACCLSDTIKQQGISAQVIVLLLHLLLKGILQTTLWVTGAGGAGNGLQSSSKWRTSWDAPRLNRYDDMCGRAPQQSQWWTAHIHLDMLAMPAVAAVLQALQMAAYHDQLCIHNQDSQLWLQTCCPCFGVYIAGPYLQ
jgi:hypothetical protein